jgi:general secretion pathway protein F
MGAFDYSAVDGEGRVRKGVLEGDTARHIRQQLRDRGLVPLTVDELARREKRRTQRYQRGISAAELALITRDLSTLVRAGLPLDEALSAVARQTSKGRLNKLVLGVRSRVMEGHALASALADFPHVFPELYRATVGAGERSGNLDLVLDRLADYTEARQGAQQKVLLALLYPALLSLVSIVVVIALLTYVVPEVVQVFEGVGQELPFLTRALIAISDGLAEWGVAIAVALVAGLIGFAYLLRLQGFRLAVHRMLLSMPLAGRLVRGVNVSRFASTLSILLESSVPLVDALRVSASVVTNLPLRQAIDDAARRVREGENLHNALGQSRLFPPVTLQLIASGEAGGNLDQLLSRAAQYQQRETETLIAVYLGLLEPLMILFMGGMVLVIVLAILLPVFDLSQLVK